jgi:hypothetical protein
MNLPNVGRIASIGGGSGRAGGLGSLIKLALLLGIQLLLIMAWGARLAWHLLLLSASFLRFSHRLYVELRNDNVERDVIPSGDTTTSVGASRVAISPVPLRELPVYQRARHHAELT